MSCKSLQSSGFYQKCTGLNISCCAGEMIVGPKQTMFMDEISTGRHAALYTFTQILLLHPLGLQLTFRPVTTDGSFVHVISFPESIGHALCSYMGGTFKPDGVLLHRS